MGVFECTYMMCELQDILPSCYARKMWKCLHPSGTTNQATVLYPPSSSRFPSKLLFLSHSRDFFLGFCKVFWICSNMTRSHFYFSSVVFLYFCTQGSSVVKHWLTVEKDMKTAINSGGILAQPLWKNKAFLGITSPMLTNRLSFKLGTKNVKIFYRLNT